MQEHLLNSKEAADFLGINEIELKRLVRKRILPAYKIGGAYLRFKKEQLELAASRLHKPAEGAIFQTQAVTTQGMIEKTKEFLYFNDFYVISLVLIILSVIVIFTS